ncbi:MAG: DNA mismatch repair protein MutS [Candidatus Dadabacteria bacterium]|nr:MAG: DNA mismatch repair protein MutS [Candidatus Dadabacteria bacterium]
MSVSTGVARKKLPPMLTSYLEYKESYSDCLILFQVGDFYEAFFEDARTVARTLNLTLTSRDKRDPDPIPMCGVPVSSVDGYIERLVDSGFSVALISQVSSTPGPGGMVERKLERIVTPGVRLLGTDASQNKSGSVAAVFPANEHGFAIAYSSVQDGIISVSECGYENLYSELDRISPLEIILPSVGSSGKKLDRRSTWIRRIEQGDRTRVIKFRSDSYLDYNENQRSLNSITGFNRLSAAARRAVSLLCAYIDETTVDSFVSFESIREHRAETVLRLDDTTRKALEIVSNARDGGSDGTLFSIMNYTCSAGGERLLREWLINPLVDKEKIVERQQAVELLLNHNVEREQLRNLLSGVTDLERVAARIELGVVTAREMAALRDTLFQFSSLQEVLSGLRVNTGLLADSLKTLSAPGDLTGRLKSALSDNPPAVLGEGGIIRQGFDAELDRLRALRKGGKGWLIEFEAEQRKITGIASLKVKFNNVLGYFIEVTKPNVSKVPSHYTKRQSTANTERFVTDLLKERESELVGAHDAELKKERELFEELREFLRQYTLKLRTFARSLATLDVLQSFAELAARENYVKPEIDLSKDLTISNGKHPVLAGILKNRFVPNSHLLKDSQSSCVVLTGANMGGKSTYLRQAGLIVIMAQAGSFVPAESARIGIVDGVFARIGASDYLIEGESTFMVEMREIAAIISSATDRSLLLIDEVGRGTATTDGLAIAEAILEWILDSIKCRTLFATHFHELTALADRYPQVINLSVGSVDRDGEVVFTHEICEGPANRSYGIEVARLAGLPGSLLERARVMLDKIEKEKESAVKLSVNSESARQLSFFSSDLRNHLPEDYEDLRKLRSKLEKLDPDSLSPRQALEVLYDLVSAAK